MPEWDAEVEVDEQLARELISGQFPERDLSTVVHLGEGWDNTVWLTADAVAFRFPRRAIAIPGVHREMAVLPWLAGRLPAAIPSGRYRGQPTERFPWPWFGSELIPGSEIAAADLAVHDRVGLGADLGMFLRALHAVDPTPTAQRLPVDPNARGDMVRRVPRTRAALAGVAEHWHGATEAAAILDRAEALAPSGDRVLVHGDLNLRHLLVSRQGRLSGVIDWGDVCLAPRSVDLMLYWSLFDAAGRRALLDAYGPVDDETLLRARVLALALGALLAAYALDTAMPALATEALAGLDRALVD